MDFYSVRLALASDISSEGEPQYQVFLYYYRFRGFRPTESEQRSLCAIKKLESRLEFVTRKSAGMFPVECFDWRE